MLSNSIRFRLTGHLVLAALALTAGTFLQNTKGAPAPKPKPPYALVFVPKKGDNYKTICNRRDQSRILRGRFVLYAAVRSLSNVHLPSLPKKGKGQGERDAHEEDVAWLAQNLKVEYLDGTGVLRVSLASGSRREQALLVNAIVHAYFQLEVDSQKQDCESRLEELKKLLKMNQRGHAATDERVQKIQEKETIDVKDSIKRNEEALRTLPRLLEMADVPPE